MFVGCDAIDFFQKGGGVHRRMDRQISLLNLGVPAYLSRNFVGPLWGAVQVLTPFSDQDR